jgi:hypothetical protein
MSGLTPGIIAGPGAAVKENARGKNARGPEPCSPAAGHPTAVTVARDCCDRCDFAALPVLADLLEEAGGPKQSVLDHCRQPGEHARGCWVVDLVLGKG